MSAARAPRAVVVFVRAPEAGRVKTRLAAALGDEEALRIYRTLGARAVETARELPDCEVRVAFTPADRAELVRDWLGGPPDPRWLRPQCEGDLGARMAHAAGEALADGAERVVLIGSDCPALDAGTIERAFAFLETSDVVLGPASDGGYYLLGLQAVHRALFEGIPWSAPDTLAVTLAAAARSALRTRLLEEMDDVDTAADWRRWQARGTHR